MRFRSRDVRRGIFFKKRTRAGTRFWRAARRIRVRHELQSRKSMKRTRARRPCAPSPLPSSASSARRRRQARRRSRSARRHDRRFARQGGETRHGGHAARRPRADLQPARRVRRQPSSSGRATCSPSPSSATLCRRNARSRSCTDASRTSRRANHCPTLWRSRNA